MSQSSDTPIFNLKAVVLETGLKADTLRAWERRYGLPKPHRAESGHRLYTQRDIDTLKWLIARQDEGLNISRAVALWHDMTEEHGDPLVAQPIAESSSLIHSPILPDASQTNPLSADRLTELRRQWINACLAFNERVAESTLSDAFALFPVEMVCTDLIQRGLAEIGSGWLEGKITVQQEHYASALALRRLETLLAATPPPTRQTRIIVGCPPSESHTFVPLMISLLLRRRGWDVIYLGADVPLHSLELTIKTARPALVIFTAQQLHTAASLLEMSKVLLAERIPLAFGGIIFNQIEDLPSVIPGIFLGSQLKGAIEQVEKLMPNIRPVAAEIEVPREAIDTLHHYTERRARIEASVWQGMESTGIPQRYLASANASIGRNISAALTLGSMGYLGSEMAWVEDLLFNHHQMPAHLIADYFKVYYGAAKQHLGDNGQLIINWMEEILDLPPSQSSTVEQTSEESTLTK